MFYIPEFSGSVVQWVCLVFFISGPLFLIGEATGWTSFGYSKFADREQKAAVPSRLGMLIIYFPATVLVWIPLVAQGVELETWHLIIACLYTLHFGKRCLEVLFLHSYSGVMNVASVVLICGLYSSSSLISGVAATEVGAGGMATPSLGPWVIAGLLMWAVGTAINFHHHRLLANLRADGSKEYRLPRGGLFPWIACPHYLGEILAWWGFALVFRHILGAAIAWVAMTYLVGRAYKTLDWYRGRIGDQVPEGWKRLVPMVY